jgi:gamma-glutamyl-gamma-aminobutyrate hydrolase PuuD
LKKQLFRISALALALCLSAGGMPSASAQQDSACKPIIGVNTHVSGEKPEESSVEMHYLEAISSCGGIPVLLPPMSAADLASVLPHIDGVLMTGGSDYPPALYHQECQPKVKLMKQKRTNFDMALARAVLADGSLPFLGICAGCQALNIVDGGSLIQDIPSTRPDSKIQHSSSGGWKNGFSRHQVEIASESKLARAYGTKHIDVVTSHHQCVDEPGKDLAVTARSADGLAEAVEKKGDCFVVGVQWHPERDFESNRKLFEELIQQSARRHKARTAQKQAASKS